ncbi:MAG: hypothetical protein K2X76_03340 [Sphingomonas sp.]|nr:hypothetical protein [Sphingomonas sp.]
MNNRVFLFALYCMGVVGLFMATGYYGWSPFAEGGRARGGSGGGGGFIFVGGPRHK